MKIGMFQAIADIVVGAKAKQDAEYADFLAFYRQLVETLPAAAVQQFGNMSVTVVQKGEAKKCGIELTVSDFLWWKGEIELRGSRFTQGVNAVRLGMLTHLAKKAETFRLPPEDRKKLLAYLEQDEAA